MPEPIDIQDSNADLLQRFVGRTIVSIERERDTGKNWSHGENSVDIVFDDGSTLGFVGTGYDASALLTYATFALGEEQKP